MVQEFNSIDKKALIIYSLILVAVVIVSAIFIKVPAKKPATTTVSQPPQTLLEVGTGTTEVSGYKIRGGWQVYKGVTFDINYPNGFTIKASSTYESVTFSSADGITKLAVYAPLTPGPVPSEFTVNNDSEDIIDSTTGKNPTCNALICTREIIVIEAKDKSYKKKVMINQNNAQKATSAFSYQYVPSTPDSEVTDVFNHLQESLARHAQ